MSIEIFAFFLVAASLIMIGFASGPVIARKAHAEGPRLQRSNPYR